jgi:hypothetical protein
MTAVYLNNVHFILSPSCYVKYNVSESVRGLWTTLYMHSSSGTISQFKDYFTRRNNKAITILTNVFTLYKISTYLKYYYTWLQTFPSTTEVKTDLNKLIKWHYSLLSYIWIFNFCISKTTLPTNIITAQQTQNITYTSTPRVCSTYQKPCCAVIIQLNLRFAFLWKLDKEANTRDFEIWLMILRVLDCAYL